MHALSAAELLRAWEIGLNQPPLLRAVTLLVAAHPDRSTDQLAQLSLGQRNGYLLDLREELFGSQLDALAACPMCGERLTLEFATTDIRSTAALLPDTLLVAVDDRTVTFRVPNTLDLIEAAKMPNIAAARQALLRQCVTGPIDQLSARAVEAISHTMAQSDPQADVQLALTCPVCAHVWSAAFDIAAYLWTEINAWANQLLADVHLIASAYGWRETDILALSPWRRQRYLEMIGA